MDEGLSFADAALQKEVYIWSQLSDHPHIVPLLHFHETDFASFIFMPLCGGNLLQYVRLNGKGTYGGGGIQNSPPMMSNSTASLNRSMSITSNTSTTSSAGHNNASTVGGGGKIGRSGSIRLRHPGEVVSGGMGLPFSTVQRIFSQIVLGLEYLHLQAKVTHKDIKLENILLDEVPQEGGGVGNENFRISDFGLAHAVEIMSAASFGSGEGGELGYISPPWRKGGRFDPRARREHALSDGDAQDIMMSSAPSTSIHFPSLGEAASLILPSEIRDQVPTAGPAAGSSAPSMSLPDESLLELTHGNHGKPHQALRRTATTSSPSSSLSPPAARFKPTRSSLASRRSHIHAIPATLPQLSSTFGDATAGSLQYTSPEQIRSPAPITDYSVDIWALGCVLYAMVEGKLPFDDGFEPRLRVQIMKGEWKKPAALIIQDGDNEEVQKEKKQITDILNGCLETDAKKRWTIEQVANSEWLLEHMSSIESPVSPRSSSSRGRGRRQVDNRRAQLDVQNEEADGEEDELRMRSRSRGRRPAMLRRESSQQPGSAGSRNSSSRSRRGPSVDEYRRARGETPTRNSPRSRSAGRRYNGDSLTSWEIL
jgi:serine/threonine protein kinase